MAGGLEVCRTRTGVVRWQKDGNEAAMLGSVGSEEGNGLH